MQEQQSIEAGRHSNGALSRFSRKKKIAAMTVATMTIAGAAFAYWTTTGTGTGDVETAAAAETLVVHQTPVVTELSPGSPAAALSGTFDNPNAGAVMVTSLSPVVSVDSTHATAGCLAEWYVVGGTLSVPAGGLVPAGTGGTWSGHTISMTDALVDQDACKGATVTITYTVVA